MWAPGISITTDRDHVFTLPWSSWSNFSHGERWPLDASSLHWGTWHLQIAHMQHLQNLRIRRSMDDQLMISWWLERNCWVIWGCNGRNRRRALGQFGSRSSGQQLWNTTVSCHKKSAFIFKKICTFDSNKEILPNALVSANLELWSGLLLELATSKVYGEWRTCHAIHVSSGVSTPKLTMAHQSEFDIIICDYFQIYDLISCDSNRFHVVNGMV